MANNVATCSPPGCDTAAGGGIFADRGPLTLTRTQVSNNASSCSLSPCKAFGAGVFSNATAAMNSVQVTRNIASCSGTGCFARGGGVDRTRVRSPSPAVW